jgi:hypothetical protein
VFWSLLAVPVLTNLVAAMGQLGFEKLTYLLRYLWRLKASRLGRMNPDAHSEEARNKSVPDPDLVIDSNSHAPDLTKAGQPYNNVPGSSAYKKNEGGARLFQAAQRSLLLGVEIGKLISTLQGSGPTQLDLESEWDRILPLLHPESDGCDLLETTSLATLYSHRGTVLEFLDCDRRATDMNKEILWMLKFLTERVCSNLQEALEQSERSGTLS